MTEYERGFIDGVKSKVTAELTPVITKMAGGLNQTIQEAVKTVIGNVKITANEPSTDVQPVKRGRWIKKAEDYYKAWQDSGRSWDDMPYFVTGLKFACSNCFEQFDVNAEGVEKWNGCPLCLVRMDGEKE